MTKGSKIREWDIVAGLSVTTLTPFHALKEASLQFNENLLVFGASGNTGMMAIQFAKKMGAKVIAISTGCSNSDCNRDNVTYLFSLGSDNTM